MQYNAELLDVEMEKFNIKFCWQIWIIWTFWQRYGIVSKVLYIFLRCDYFFKTPTEPI